MKTRKTTVGFVVQVYDTKTGRCIEQDFIAGDQVDYEDEHGEPIEWQEQPEAYQPFDMIQPGDKTSVMTPFVFVIKENSIQESICCKDGEQAEDVLLERLKSHCSNWDEYDADDKARICEDGGEDFGYTGGLKGRIEIHWMEK